MALVLASLEENEAVIERGLGTFSEVGEALLAIRDGRQYLEAADENGELFTTFEGYCRSRWGMSRTHTFNTIAAAEIAFAIENVDPAKTPATESQARALAPLRHDPEAMAEAIEQAARATGGRPTAAAITEAVKHRFAAEDLDPYDKVGARAMEAAIDLQAALQKLPRKAERLIENWEAIEEPELSDVSEWRVDILTARDALDALSAYIERPLAAVRRIK